MFETTNLVIFSRRAYTGVRVPSGNKEKNIFKLNKMNLQPTDIIIRKTDGTETLWLSQRLVMEVCGISESYFEKAVRDRYKKSVRSCDLAKSKEFLPDSGKAWDSGGAERGFKGA